jgi:hypothetical protein
MLELLFLLLTELLEIEVKKLNDNIDGDQYSKNNYEFFQDIENVKLTVEVPVSII